MNCMHKRSAFALMLMLVVPLAGHAQDDEGIGAEAAVLPESDELGETVPVEPPASDDDASVDEPSSDEEPADEAPADEAPADESTPVAGPSTDEPPAGAATEAAAGAVDSAEEVDSSGAANRVSSDGLPAAHDFDAVIEPGPAPGANATKPSYEPPADGLDRRVADLSRANGTNRWNAFDVEPNRREIRLHLGSNNQQPADNGLDAFLFDEGRFISGRFGVEAALGNGIAVGATWAWGRDGEYIFGEVDTEFEVRGGDAFARYTFEPLALVRPYVQAEVGVRSVRVRIDADDASLADEAMGFAWGAFGGVELRYPTRNLSFALYNEHGYQGTTTLAFDEARWSDSDAASVDLGDLALSGYTWRMGVRVGVAF